MSSKKPVESSGNPPGPIVVALATCGTSFQSLERLFAHMPADTGAAFVVVGQQENAIDPVHMLESLGRQSGLPAVLMEEGGPVEGGVIHVVPPNKIAVIEAGHLHLEASTEPVGSRGTIDSLLISMADAYGDRGIAVLLQGLGLDGVSSVRALKECGGFALVEASDHPIGAAQTAAEGIADLVLPVEELAVRIADQVRSLTQDSDPAPANEVTEHLTKVAAILRNRTGHDFHGYKQNTFVRRIQRRMQVLQIGEIGAYVEHLRVNGEEGQHLFQDLLIGVTQFFRDEKEFELLEREVIPRLFEGKGAADQVRVWVLGCSTGEEAYSIAMLLREYASRLDITPQLQIFATDIDGRALSIARAGRYPEAINKHMTADRLARWFTREGATYVVSKELREMCIFSAHNVIRDAPFSRIDLVSCRNLLIYLDSDLQNRVIPLFHFALRAGGHLFLGPSENLSRHAKLFTPVDRRMRIFRKLESASRVMPQFPLSVGDVRRPVGDRPLPRNPALDIEIGKRAERLADRYAPAYVVIDEQFEIMHFSGRTGRYLDPASGAANLNLMSLVNRDLRIDLRAAIHRALTSRESVKLDGLRMEAAEGIRAVNVVVELIPGAADRAVSVMVLFQDAPAVIEDGSPHVGDPAYLRDEHIQRLEAELRLTKERLQATIEELESTNEELKSSNEEYQSINEEMQSANEELETSKEELQSVNEELQTVNGELGHRVNELAGANSDLKNLLESTQIATLFLDNDLRVKSYTPAMAGIFNLIETDQGRPILHIAPSVLYPDLEEDVRKVLRTLSTIEREVAATQGKARYIVRVLPYRSVDNFIAGVVLTFLDITATVQAEKALTASEERFRRMAQVAPVFLFIARGEFEWNYINPRFYEYTGLPEGSALEDGWLAAVHPDDVEENRELSHQSALLGRPLEQPLRLRDGSGAYRWFMVRAESVLGPDGKVAEWFGSFADIHELRVAETRQRLLLAELQHRVKNILAVVRSIATRTARNTTSVEDFNSHFDGRISALARSQSILARRAEGGVELEELVRDELLAHGVVDDRALEVTGPPVMLRPKAAETLGLALHELATNAVKYGALSLDSGRLSITWRIYESSAGPRLALEWQEAGVPVVNPNPARKGFGRQLIERGLPYELGASTAMEFQPGGLRCVVELPLTEQVVLLPSNDRSASDEGAA